MLAVNMNEATWMGEEKTKGVGGQANSYLVNIFRSHMIVSGAFFIHSLSQLGKLS